MFVVVGGRTDRDVHPPGGGDIIEVDLGEDELLGDSECVVATAVERPRVEAPEVTNAGDGHRQQPVEELPHPVAAQGDRGTDGSAFPELETGDRLTSRVDSRLLARDEGELVGRLLDDLAILVGGSESHVDHDLLEPWHLHPVFQTEIVKQLLGDLLFVLLLETGSAHRSPPHFRHTRCLRPSSSMRTPMRVGPQSSQTSITFDRSMGMSRSMIPPCMVCPRGFSWRLAVLTPSTITLPFLGSTRVTRDSLPRSLPEMTITR